MSSSSEALDPPAEQLVDQTGGTAEEAATGAYNATTVNDKIFEELRLSSDVVLEVQHGWRAFLDAAESREAAGEEVFAALRVPCLQRHDGGGFQWHIYRFLQGLSLIIDSLSDPKGLMVVIETLGIQRLDLEITGPRVIRFRDAIVGLLVAEMGARLSQKARVGFATMLNYVGGSYIFIRRREFAILHLRRELTRALAMAKQGSGNEDENSGEE